MIDFSRFVWRVGHDPNSQNLLRNQCYDRTKSLLSEIQEIEAPQVFVSTKLELENFLENLPGEWMNLRAKSLNGDRLHIVTKERVSKVFNLWDLTDSRRSIQGGRLKHGPRERLVRKFSLHLGQLLAMEEFLSSENEFLFLLDDDIELADFFLVSVAALLEELPSDWDIFNFAVPEHDKKNFRPHLRVTKNISIPYCYFYPTAMMISRSGVQRYLYDFLYDVENLRIGDDNIDKCIDGRIANLNLLEPFDDPLHHYYVDWSSKRKFKSYTFTPDAQTPVQIAHAKSLWQ